MSVAVHTADRKQGMKVVFALAHRRSPAANVVIDGAGCASDTADFNDHIACAQSAI